MDISLGSSTVQLHATVKVADAHAHVQRQASLVKMATMLEECITQEQRCIVRLFVGKRTQRKGYS
jgi:hypothetical protein